MFAKYVRRCLRPGHPFLILAITAGACALSGFAAPPDSTATVPAISPDDIRLHVGYLASAELGGRRTGTEGERLATQYAANVFANLGLVPAGDAGTFFQSFEITAGLSLGDQNRLTVMNGDAESGVFPVDVDWRPTAFTSVGETAAAPVVFAGYGIAAPDAEGMPAYDSYAHLDVAGAWVLVFRYVPENAPEELRQHLSRFANLRYKAMVARDNGAIGIIIVSGPNAKAADPLVPLSSDASLSGSSVAVISVTDAIATRLLGPSGRTLKELQDGLDSGAPQMGFKLDGLRVKAKIDIRQERRTARNVLARLNAGDAPSGSAIVIGAHIDHLGQGASSASLAKDGEKDLIHFGADDNASGTAGLFELAQWLAHEKSMGSIAMKRDIIFAAWSGEEMGLLGSHHFAETWHGAKTANDVLTPGIAACLNMDMIGRLRQNVVLFGAGSSTYWKSAIERCNATLQVPVVLRDDAYLPSDATSFQLKSVPSITAFTGAHEEYHTPRDTVDTLHYDGAARVVQLMATLAWDLCTTETPPEFVASRAPENPGQRAGLRAYLGTIPDYAQTDITGVKLGGVTKGAPADLAGVKPGDVVIELGGKKIDNIYDYTYAIERLRIGEKTSMTLLRGIDKIAIDVTPGSRE